MGQKFWIIVELLALASKSFDNACGSSSKQAIDPPAHDRVFDQDRPKNLRPRRPRRPLRSRFSSTAVLPLLDPWQALFSPCSHSTALSLLVLVGPFGFVLLSSSSRWLLTSFLDIFSPAASSTISTSQRDTSQHSFLLTWTWSFDYHSLIDIDNPRHPLRDTQKQRAPTNSLFLY
jgi:hypothetical protein